MKIYKLRHNVKDYQSLFPEDEEIWKGSMLHFDCTPKTASWIPPKVYVLHPKLKRGRFFKISPGAFAIDSHAAELLREFLEMSGELLPLPFNGEELFVFNALECVNVLNDEKTQWSYVENTGTKIRILKHSFHPNRLEETPLFKIPETCKVDILTVEGLNAPQDEFKHNVESHGLEGLIFEEIWSSEE